MTDRIGQQFGNYRLTRLLGKGGFADVYAGEHIYLNTEAAIKLVSSGLATHDMQNFLNEARNLSRLIHPHIIRVLEFGVEEQTPFLVMDYAPHGTLRQWYPPGTPMPVPTVISYVKQVAEALQYAHEQKIIHRDIKPENMLLGRSYEILLSDFGISLVLQSTESMDLQRMMGTVAYMAPEQMQGKPRPTSDQYALGIVAYEWLSGEQPFRGTLQEVFRQHLYEQPASLHEKIPAVSPAVEQVVFKAMAKEPQQRFEDVRAFAIALEYAYYTALPEPDFLAGASEQITVQEPPAEPPKEHFQNLPEQLTRFVGREQEIEAVCMLLLRPQVRLLTFTGMGGVGKTRLSLQAANELLNVFADGVCFVALAPLRNHRLVVPTIAHTLGIGQSGAEPLLERLKTFLRDKHLLLLLDNFEQVVDAAPVLTEVLEVCPMVKMLVTSRVVLHVRGEHEFPVSPLAVPNPKLLPDLETLSSYSSIALFNERAMAVKPTFQLTETNAHTVAEICLRLDGLPLAIELAAARIKLLPPTALLTRLEHRLQVLTSASRDVPTRQQTLRNTIAWSYDLLNAGEQQLFRRLCAFVAGCTLEAVEAVYDALGDDPSSVLDGVTSLLDKSLLQHIEQEGDEIRIGLLETIREYGLECLAERGEMVNIRRVHADYYLALAEQAGQELSGVQQLTWLQWLEREHDNLRAAMRWLIAQGEHGERESVEKALRLCAAIWWFWSVRGYVGEGRYWLGRALAISENVVLSVRAAAIESAGMLAYAQDDHKKAVELLEQSLALFRELGNEQHIGTCLYRLGLVAWSHGHEIAKALAEETLQIFEKLGDKNSSADAYLLLAYIAFEQPAYERARWLAEESVRLFRETSDKWGVAYSLVHLARVLTVQGDYTLSRSLLEESLALSRELDYKGGIISYLEVLAEIAVSYKQLRWATQLWGAAALLRERIGIPLQPVEQTSYERKVADVRASLGEKAFSAAYAEGRAMTPEQAIAALGISDVD
jgi:predicted ATPase